VAVESDEGPPREVTPEEIRAEREWLDHYAAHLNTIGHEARNAVATARVCLARLADNAENGAAEAELKPTMSVLRAHLQYRPVLPLLPRALVEGWFLPLDQQRVLGVRVASRPAIPRVHSKWDSFAPRRDRR
jgi:hypothetical protein